MKLMKRLFRKRRNKKPEEPEDKSGSLKSKSDFLSLSGGKKGAFSNKPSKEDIEDSKASENEKVTYPSKYPSKFLPKKVLESKQGSKKEDPAVSTEPESKIEQASTSDPSGKRAHSKKWSGDEKAVFSSKKPEGRREKLNGNGTFMAPLKDKVDEVVVPQSDIEERHSTISRAYNSIPLLEQTKLPRGGISVETNAVGRVQVRRT